MDLIELIVTICAVASPTTCEEAHLQFAWNGSPQQCVTAAPPYIAQWIGEHPKWNAVRWRCEYRARGEKPRRANERVQHRAAVTNWRNSFGAIP